jgi:ATP-dependent Clp protease adaptor protein ClpS
MSSFNTKPFQEEESDVLTEEAKKFQLILYNDDVNTFEFVSETLIKICRHDPIQAEQCTWLVHYVGKCCVKEGEFSNLEPICTALLDRGLSATIE